MAVEFETYDKFLTTSQSREKLDATLTPYDSSTPTGFSSAPRSSEDYKYVALNRKPDAPKIAFSKDASDEEITAFLKSGAAQQAAKDMGYLYTFGLNARRFDDPDDLDDTALTKGFKAGWSGLKQIGQGALGTIYDIVGAEGLEDLSNKAIQQYQLDGAAKQFYTNSKGEIVPFETSMEKVFESDEKFSNFVDWLAFNVGNAAATSVPMFAASVINPALAVGLAYGMGVGDSRISQLEATGFTNANAGLSLAMGVPYAAVEYMFDGGAVLGRIVKNKMAKGTSSSYMKNIGKGILGTSLKESFAEGTQEVITSTAGATEKGLLPGESIKNSLAQLYNDKDFYKQVAESAAAGFAGGGPFGIAGGTLKTIRYNAETKEKKSLTERLEGTIDNATIEEDNDYFDQAGLNKNRRYTVGGEYTALDVNKEVIKDSEGNSITPEYVVKGTAKVNGVDSIVLQSTLRGIENPVIAIAKKDVSLLTQVEAPETGDGSTPPEEEEETIEMMNTNSFNAKKRELKKRGWIVEDFKPQDSSKNAEAIRRQDVADAVDDELNYISPEERQKLAALGYGDLGLRPQGPLPEGVNIGDGSFGESEILSMERDIVVPKGQEKGKEKTSGRLRLEDILNNNIPYEPRVLTEKYVSGTKKTEPLSQEELVAQGITTGYMDSYTDDQIIQEQEANNRAIEQATDSEVIEILKEDNRRLSAVSELKNSYPVVRYNKLKNLIRGTLNSIGGESVIYKASNIPNRINKLTESLERIDRAPGITAQDKDQIKFNLSLQLEFYKRQKRLLQELFISLGQDTLTDTEITNLTLTNKSLKEIITAIKGKETKVYKQETTYLYQKGLDDMSEKDFEKLSDKEFDELLEKEPGLSLKQLKELAEEAAAEQAYRKVISEKRAKLEKVTKKLAGMPKIPEATDLSSDLLNDIPKIKEIFRQELDRLGLDKVDLDIVIRMFMKKGNPNGLFIAAPEIAKQSIKVALMGRGFREGSTGIPGDVLNVNPADPRTWTLHHEALHALYANEFFTPEEIKILNSAAKKYWRKEYNTDKIYNAEYAKDRSVNLEDIRNEEATANKFAAYMAGQYFPNGIIEKLFSRLKVFLNGLGLSFLRLEYTSPYQIFDAVQYGAIQKRKAAEDARELKETVGNNATKFTNKSQKEFDDFFEGSVVTGTSYENSPQGLGSPLENKEFNDAVINGYLPKIRALYKNKEDTYAAKFWDDVGQLILLLTGGKNYKGVSDSNDVQEAQILLNSLILSLQNSDNFIDLRQNTSLIESSSASNITNFILGAEQTESAESSSFVEMSISPRFYLRDIINLMEMAGTNQVTKRDGTVSRLNVRDLLEALTAIELNLPTESMIAEASTPLVTYYTSNKQNQDFTDTSSPFIFTSPGSASQRFQEYLNNNNVDGDEYTVSAMLSIKNPFVLEQQSISNTINGYKLADQLVKNNIITLEQSQNFIIKAQKGNDELLKDLTIFLDKKGYDGYVFKDTRYFNAREYSKDSNREAYIPFRKNQILKVSNEATDFGNPNMEAGYKYMFDISDKPIDAPIEPTRETLRTETRQMENKIKDDEDTYKEGGTVSPSKLGKFSQIVSHARAWAKKYPLFTPLYELVSSRDRKTSSLVTQYTEKLLETFIPIMKDPTAAAALTKAFEISQQGLEEQYTDPKTGEIKTRKRPGGRYRKNENGEIIFVAQEDGRGANSTVKKGDVVVLRGDVAKAYEDVQQAMLIQHQEIIKAMLASENNTAIITQAIAILNTYRRDLLDDPMFAKILNLRVSSSQDPDSVNPYEDLTLQELEAIRTELSSTNTFLQPDGNIREDIINPVTNILGGKTANLNAIINDVRQYEKFKENDYIPLQRYGGYFITVKNRETQELVEYRQFNKGKVFNKVLNDEPNIRQDLADKYNQETYEISATQEVEIEDLRRNLGADFLTLDTVAGTLSDVNANSYIEVRKELEKLLVEKYGINKTPGFNMFLSARKEIGGVPGFETDFARSIAQYGQTSSEFASRTRYNASINSAANRLKNKDINPDDNLRKAAIKWLDYVNDPKQEWANTRRLGFWWFLGGNLSSALLQLMSNVQFVGPMLSQFANTPLAIKELGKATAEVTKMLKLGNLKFQDQFLDFTLLPDDVKEDALKDIASGLLKQGSAMREAGMPTGSAINITRSKARNAFRTAENTIIGGAFNTMETVSRLIAYIATHRLAQNPDFRKKADDFLSADQQYAFNKNNNDGIVTPRILAQHMVEEGFGIYGKLNRPQIMRGFGSTIFLFQTYVSQMFSLLYRMATAGGRGNKLVGQKIFAKMLLMLLITGGAFGLPGADDASWLASTLGRLFPGVDVDLRKEFREMLSDAGLPAKAIEYFENGVIQAAANVNVQQRLSLGVIPGSGQIRAVAGALGISSGARIEEFLGAPGAIVFQNARSLIEELRSTGGISFKGAYSALTPTFIKNLGKGYSYSVNGGRAYSKQGTLITDNLNALDIVLQAAGFTPTEISKNRELLRLERFNGGATQVIRSRFNRRIKEAFRIAMIGRQDSDVKAIQESQKQLQEIMIDLYKFNSSQEWTYQFQPDLYRLLQEAMQDVYKSMRLSSQGLKDMTMNMYDAQLLGVKTP